jgi:hypothetical protein
MRISNKEQGISNFEVKEKRLKEKALLDCNFPSIFDIPCSLFDILITLKKTTRLDGGGSSYFEIYFYTLYTTSVRCRNNHHDHNNNCG